MLKGKNILLGVTGGIAAYKAAEISSRLVKAGAEVNVVMTESAKKFIAPETFRAITNKRVYTSVFEETDGGVLHVDLAQKADCVLVAPATADFIAKAALGMADDMLSAAVLAASNKKIIIAPAMNCHMYENEAVQENIKKLMDRGFVVIEPEVGHLACGEEGVGRLPEPETIVERTSAVFSKKLLSGKRALVTAGATIEAIDPVRFISNRSSGKMGCAMAQAARDMGAEVTLIAGKLSIKPPYGVRIAEALSAREMYEKTLAEFDKCDIVVMTAAVADYRPKKTAENKIKKSGDILTLELERTDDILEALGRRKENQLLAGFCMETENLIENAEKKLRAKNLDLICANSLKTYGAGFGEDTNVVTVIEKGGEKTYLPLDTKYNIALKILEICAARLG